jgi:hypothetical protein
VAPEVAPGRHVTVFSSGLILSQPLSDNHSAPRSSGELQHLNEIARSIRQHVRSNGEVIFSFHARSEIAPDQLNAVDVRDALKACAVVRRELHGTDWRATCQGRTLSEPIEVAVKVIDALTEEVAGGPTD